MEINWKRTEGNLEMEAEMKAEMDRKWTGNEPEMDRK